MTRTGGRVTAASAATLLLLCALLGLGGAAHAAAYRYWSFWDREADGSGWAYATQGPSTARPSDGDVQGFRFAVSEDSDDAAEPRGTARFDTICAGTDARDGQKRIALVLDFGTAADAPAGETPPPARTACARVPSDATTADALAAVAKPLRYDTNALLCAIAGYPRKGCGEVVADDGPDASAGSSGTSGSTSGTAGTSGASDDPAASENARASDGKGPSVGVFVGVGAVAVLGAAAVWQAGRRRRG
ncbi:SCO2322 family protein [Streptomyces sp. HM190]|uniref:SCO2322 family protein n=1 Tax=Streptomyces sp. HM190 TaxID=2695266 RepID=UPI0013597425|nr:SCO2322 family protein [Streptomyces sp. HM190]